jgi:hypothetical protein
VNAILAIDCILESTRASDGCPSGSVARGRLQPAPSAATYTTVDPVTRTFTLLGAQVTVEATPTSYTWHFDSGLPDGTRTTSTPGAPYPDLDVTYAYQDAHTTVRPSVDVTYSARFSVDGGTWQTIPDTVTIEGEPIRRYVAEASARLAEMN